MATLLNPAVPPHLSRHTVSAELHRYDAYILAPLAEWTNFVYHYKPKFTGGGSSFGEPAVESYTILTTSPGSELSALHSRMPVMISNTYAEDWLHSPVSEAKEVLRLATPKGVVYYKTEPLKYCGDGPVKASANHSSLF